MKPKNIYQMYLRMFTPSGTLAAAEEMIPYLADLGIDCIYLSALNQADDAQEGQSPRQLKSGIGNPKNPYRITDYYAVDEEYGNMEDLKRFVESCHRANIKVLIDLVYMHCGPNAVFIKEHPNFVKRDENGDIQCTSYGFPLINIDNPELREYLWANMEFYLTEIKADGFRCDVAEEVPLDFWKEAVRRLKKIKPDLIMLDEGGIPDYLEAFDLLYGGGLEGAINRVFHNKQNSKKAHKVDAYHFRPLDAETVYNAEHIRTAWEKSHEKTPLCSSLNQVENHDIANDAYYERSEAHLGHDAVEAMLALIFTFDGIPMIFNGMEFADSGRRTLWYSRFYSGAMVIDWSKLATAAGRERFAMVKHMIAMRNGRKSLTEGDLSWTEHDNTKNVLGFTRCHEQEKTQVFVNVTAKVQKTKVQGPLPGKILASKNAYVQNGSITLLPYGYLITE
ncbi:MAG: hypothetical protein E7400_01855 [Ruminococcaceae bacterium]|nr:hypothetical protein [Oscillospiraceae bacterium]